jgi:hypothetical protein
MTQSKGYRVQVRRNTRARMMLEVITGIHDDRLILNRNCSADGMPTCSGPPRNLYDRMRRSTSIHSDWDL